MTCPFCHQPTASLPAHYGSDDCPALTVHFGAVTAAGRAREADTHYKQNSMEAARLAPKCMHAGKVRRGPRVMRKIRA